MQDALDTLFDEVAAGDAVPLPDALASRYGALRFPKGSPHVIGNFVSTLDGVVSLRVPGKATGGPISGENPADLMLMGILRACADVILEGAGTQRQAPRSSLHAADVYPPLAEAYAELRRRLHKPPTPRAVVVSASGGLDLSQRLFSSGEMPVVILTRAAGAHALATQTIPSSVEVKAVPGDGPLAANEMIEALGMGEGLLLVEGGPHLMTSFVADRRLDELFLTMAPQVAGRDDGLMRPGFVHGRSFAPDDPRWGALVGVKRSASHLFLRYAFPSRGDGSGPEGRVEGPI